MTRLRSTNRLRRTITILLTTLVASTTGASIATPLAAQELPVGVTDELVEQALSQEIDVPPSSGVRDRLRVPRLLAWFAISLSLVILAVGLWRGAWTIPGIGSAPEARAARPDVQREPGPLEGVARARRERETRRGAPTAPKETLRLPPHVTEMLARAAARREAEAAAAAEPPSPASEPPAEETPNDGLDFVVPAYDPWKGE